MRILRTLSTLSVAGIMALSLSGCGEGNAGNGGNNTGDQASTAETPADGATTAADDASAEASTEESTGGTEGGNTKIGISLPQKTSENWVEAENYFKEACAEQQLECTIQFANGGVSEQQNQVDAMLASGVEALIVGAIDGSSLGSQAEQAKQQNIPVIAYDRLLTNTEAVDYYVAYDSFEVGVKQGEALLEGLKKNKGDGPYKIELVAGSNDDSNSARFFDGAMSVLQPKIDDGTLTIPSGQTSQSQAATQGWDPKNAQSRMDAILAANYSGGDEVPDGILSPNDTLARAVLTSVEQAGKEQPVVTGQDSEVESLKWIMQGKQYSTISKPTKPLVESSLQVAVEAKADSQLEEVGGIKVNTDQYNNGTKDVASFLLEPIVATKDNAAEVYKDEPSKLEAVENA